jgi:hypothetical protein
MNCPVCNVSQKNIRGLMCHIKIHKYNSKKLYDDYVKKVDEGFCSVCSKETKYVNYTLGYSKFCSNKCSNNYNVTNYWNSDSDNVKKRRDDHREKFKKYQNTNGRPKGSKNKNSYPLTDKVLKRYIDNPPPSWRGKKHKEETKEKMSKIISTMIENGEIKQMGSYKGKFVPQNSKKYIGDVRNIVYRSLWERKFMIYCDTNENVLEYSSEEIIVNYFDPTTNKIRRYFPDFYIKVKEPDGSIKKYLIEIKPHKQTMPPSKPKRQTKGYIYEAYEYAKNQSKWEAAREYCKDRGWTFRILTENELGIGKK